jgi:hypothetical protein
MKLQEFKRKIGIDGNYEVGDTKDKSNPDCTMFNPVRESLMGLVGISSINCHA